MAFTQRTFFWIAPTALLVQKALLAQKALMTKSPGWPKRSCWPKRPCCPKGPPCHPRRPCWLIFAGPFCLLHLASFLVTFLKLAQDALLAQEALLVPDALLSLMPCRPRRPLGPSAFCP